jgi:uncharacterized protein YdhG (YjbR/CyaY superfamily)
MMDRPGRSTVGKSKRGQPSRPTARSESPKAGRTKVSTIDDYLATVTGERRRALDQLRKTIRSLVPRAEECISYGLPAFRLDGVVVAGFSATTKGCSYFPFSGSTLRTLASLVVGYDKTKGSLHFRPDEGLPVSLVRKLVNTRIAETR